MACHAGDSRMEGERMDHSPHFHGSARRVLVNIMQKDGIGDGGKERRVCVGKLAPDLSGPSAASLTKADLLLCSPPLLFPSTLRCRQSRVAGLAALADGTYPKTASPFAINKALCRQSRRLRREDRAEDQRCAPGPGTGHPSGSTGKSPGEHPRRRPPVAEVGMPGVMGIRVESHDIWPQI